MQQILLICLAIVASLDSQDVFMNIEGCIQLICNLQDRLGCSLLLGKLLYGVVGGLTVSLTPSLYCKKAAHGSMLAGMLFNNSDNFVWDVLLYNRSFAVMMIHAEWRVAGSMLVTSGYRG